MPKTIMAKAVVFVYSKHKFEDYSGKMSLNAIRFNFFRLLFVCRKLLAHSLCFEMPN